MFFLVALLTFEKIALFHRFSNVIKSSTSTLMKLSSRRSPKIEMTSTRLFSVGDLSILSVIYGFQSSKNKFKCSTALKT
jgi:hypothetical protein